MPLFGYGPSAAVTAAPQVLRDAVQADHDGLDLFTIPDHPYYGERLDAYATMGVVLGRTTRITAVSTVTNLPARPAPMLARSRPCRPCRTGGWCWGSAAGGFWDEIVRLGVPRLTPGAAVRAMEEAITLVRALTGGGAPVSFDGESCRVTGLDPSPVPVPRIWTGSVGPRSLAVTGRLADGWIPGRASDWLSPLYRESRALVDDAAAAAGRDPAEIASVYNLPGRITARPLPATRDRSGRWIGGSAGQWAEELASAVLDHGASGFVFFDAGGSDAPLSRWAQEIAPAVRAAVPARNG